jgi:deoxyribonuclease V
MKIHPLHSWNLDYKEAVALQRSLAERVRTRRISLRDVRHVAGADIAVSRRLDLAVGAVSVFSLPDLELIEERLAVTQLSFPYIPGLLSFREIPVLIECFRSVRTAFDVLICDGQGIAHPRRLGLASHLGLLLRTPTIGCAKSLLVGEFGDLGRSRGHFAPLRYEGKRVGSVLRTRTDVKPVFVSPGHLADQAGSRRIVLSCSSRYRLPEPIRHADRLAGEKRRRLEIRRSP